MQRPDIETDRVDLWYTYVERANSAEQLQRYYDLLSDEERDRVARLRLQRVRDEYLVTRALVRCVLSHYAGVEPRLWEFTQSGHGKPLVRVPWEGYQSFNLSHSAGLVVCAVAATGQIGVDVESLDRKTTGIQLAERFFSTAEVEMLLATPEARQQEVFIQIWTLKESYIKAIGHGLSMPLNSFFLAFREEGPPVLHLSHRPEQPVDDWHFAQVRLAPRHHISLAVSEPRLNELIVCARETIPLADFESPHVIECRRENNWFATGP